MCVMYLVWSTPDCGKHSINAEAMFYFGTIWEELILDTKKHQRLGMVTHACDLSTLGG